MSSQSFPADPPASSTFSPENAASNRPQRPTAPGSRLFTPNGLPPPRTNGQYLPSDLLSEDDLKRIRNNTLARALGGGIIGGGIVTGIARVVMPKGTTKIAMMAVGLSGCIFSQIIIATTYLKSQIDPIKAQAAELSRPRTADGFPVFTDAAHTNELASAFPESVTRQPLDATGDVAPAREDGGHWGRLRDGRTNENELRDTFFRPGVPRRDV